MGEGRGAVIERDVSDCGGIDTLVPLSQLLSPSPNAESAQGHRRHMTRPSFGVAFSDISITPARVRKHPLTERVKRSHSPYDSRLEAQCFLSKPYTSLCWIL